MKLVAYARVCPRMFPYAAFASSAGAVSRDAPVEQVDRDLAGTDRDSLFAFDAAPAAPSVSPEDSSVLGAAASVSFLPPALGAPSAEQARFREEARSTLQSLSAPSAAPGTVRTNEATLRAIAPKITARLSSRALPLESGGVPYAFFTAVLFLGPKSPSSVTGQPAVHRSYVSPVKAAAAFWHVARGGAPRSTPSGPREWGRFGLASAECDVWGTATFVGENARSFRSRGLCFGPFAAGRGARRFFGRRLWSWPLVGRRVRSTCRCVDVSRLLRRKTCVGGGRARRIGSLRRFANWRRGH